MDLEEWEFLSNDGSLLVDFHDHYGRHRRENRFFSTPNSFINMNYFICPRQPSSPQPCAQNLIKPTLEKAIATSNLEHILVALDSETMPEKAQDLDFLEKIKGPLLLNYNDQENDRNQVSFEKMKENEFVDMKLDSPKSKNSKGITLQLGPVKYQFDHKADDDAMEIMKNPFSPRMRSENEMTMMINPISPKMKSGMDTDSNWDDKQERFNIWKWSLNGAGTLCSIGVAAVTICILILGKTHRNRNQKHNIQIFTDEKRMKNVVEHASKFNETISAVRAQLSKAHITFGGHYNAV